MSRLISFAVLIAIIIIIGLLFYKVLIGFFIPVFLAAVLVVVFRPAHRWVLEKTGHRDQLAAALTTGLIVLTMFLPIAVVVSAAAAQGLSLTSKNGRDVINLRINTIRKKLGLDMPPFLEELRAAENEIQEIVKRSDGSDLSDVPAALVNQGRRARVALETLKSKVIGVDSSDIAGSGSVDSSSESAEIAPDDSADSEPVEANNSDAELEETTEATEDETPTAQHFTTLFEMIDSMGQPVDEEENKFTGHSVVEIKSEFVDLKTELLGGTVMTFAKELANPTAEKQAEWTENALNYVQPRLLSITGATGGFIVKLVFGGIILIVATFFFLYDGPAMLKTIMHLSPLDDAYEQELLLEFDRISRAVVVATLLSAVVQGLTAGLGYAVVGMNFLILLIMLTTVFAMVPFVGPAVIWVPVCLYVGVYEGRYTAAILLATWGVLVVGTIDNVVKAFVLHGQSQLHPLLALLSVLGGVQTLGPIGIVVGPMVVAMLQTLLSILQRELIHFDKQNLVVSTQGLSVSTSSGNGRSSRLSKRKSRQAADQEVDAVEDAPTEEADASEEDQTPTAQEDESPEQ